MARQPLKSLALFLSLIVVLSGAAFGAPGQTAVLSKLEVDKSVDGDVVVFGADLELGPAARVHGDAVAIGGDVRVARGAVVTRHVVAVFGRADVSRDAEIGGRVLSFSSLATVLPASSGRTTSFRPDVAMRLLTAGGWLLVTTGIAFLFPIRIRFGAWAVPMLGFKIPALGMMVGLTVVASLIAALGLGPNLGVPLVAGLMVVSFAAKSVGLTVVGCWLGAAILRRVSRYPQPISLEVFVGVLVLLALRFLPMVGATLWNLISLTALGAGIAAIGVSTDLGRAQASSFRP